MDYLDLPFHLQEQIMKQVEDETDQEFDEGNYAHLVRAQELCDEGGLGEPSYNLNDMER